MRTQSRRLAPSDSAISFMLRKACRMRASSPCTNVLVLGSMPRMPATKTKSPARVPTSHVPVVLIAPSGASVLTPLGEDDCASAAVAPASKAAAATIRLRMLAPLSRLLPTDLCAARDGRRRRPRDTSVWTTDRSPVISPSHGVWKQINEQEFQATWTAFQFDEKGNWSLFRSGAVLPTPVL